MAEVIGLVSGVAQIVTISLQISQLCHRYISDVIKAPRTQKAYLQEVLALTEVLFRLEDAIQNSETIGFILKLPPEFSELVLSECKQELASQRIKLEEHKHRLIWPFRERDSRKAIDDLHRFRSIFADCLAANTAIITSATHHSVSTIKQDDDRNTLLDWLQIPHEWLKAPPEILSGTGSWLLNHSRFQEWMTGPPSALWCYGPPGVGKSSLASKVIEHLSKETSSHNIYVVSFFADYLRRKEQTETLILKAILRQVVEQTSQELLTFLLQRRDDLGQSPKSTDLGLIFTTICRKQKMFFVFDAADEVDNLKRLITRFESFVKAGCRVLITSRDHPDLRTSSLSRNQIQIVASTNDLQAYVQDRFQESDFNDQLGTQHSIVDAVVSKADGLFLLAKLVMDQLLGLPTLKKMRQALGSLPTQLNEAFESSLQRINSQPSALRDLAHRAINWIVNVERPLRSAELAQAFAVEYGDEELDEEGVLHASTLFRVCAGLVVLDRTHNTFVLVHGSAYEYFNARKISMGAATHEDIARTCLTYLSLRPFKAGPCRGIEEMNDRLRQFPFLNYAAHFWGKHAAHEGVEQKLSRLIYCLLDDPNLLACSFQALHHNPLVRSLDLATETFETLPRQQSRLHVASFWGLQLTTKELLQSGEIVSSADSQQWTSLHWAASNGHLAVARILLEAGAEIEAKDSQGWTPIFWASLKGNISVLQLLMDNGADCFARDVNGWTPLRWAVSAGQSIAVMQLKEREGQTKNKLENHSPSTSPTPLRKRSELYDDKSVVELAAELEDIELFEDLVKARGPSWTKGALDLPTSNFWRVLNKSESIRGMNVSEYNDHIPWKSGLLQSAIKDERLQVMKLLLETGADVNYESSRSALHIASFRENPDFVRILLEYGADTSVTDLYGQTALHQAVLNGFERTIVALLDGGSNVNAKRQYRERISFPKWGLAQGQTPIMLACGYNLTDESMRSRQGRIIDLLLLHGADVSTHDDNKKSGLQYAAMSGHLEFARKALEAGADVNAQDKDGIYCLHSAVRSLSIDSVKLLLQHGANIRSVDNAGRGAIQHLAEAQIGGATRKTLTDIIDLLCPDCDPALLNAEYDAFKARNVSYTSSCMQYQTALSMAVERREWVLFDILRESQAGLPRIVWPLLRHAIESQNLSVLRFLIENGAKLDGKTDISHSLRSLFTWHTNKLEIKTVHGILDCLIGIGFNIDQLDQYSGEPLLATAAEHCLSRDLPAVFWTNGADLFCHTRGGLDAFLVAAIKGNLSFLHGLFDIIKMIEIPEGHWLKHIDSHSSLETDAVLLEQISAALTKSDKLPSAADRERRPILTATVVKGNRDLVEQLISHGAHVTLTDSHGWQPLHWAALQCNVAIVECLISQGGADVNATTRSWPSDHVKPSGLYNASSWTGTALHISALMGNVDITRYLLRHGANVNASSSRSTTETSYHCPLHGPTALHIALGTGHSYGLAPNLGNSRLEIAGLLIEHGARLDHVADHLRPDDFVQFKGFEDTWRRFKPVPEASKSPEHPK